MIRCTLSSVKCGTPVSFHDRRRGYPHVSTGGGSAALLSDAFQGWLSCNHPALSGTRYASQFACRDLHLFLPTANIFADKRSLLPSSRDVPHRSFGLHQFVELEPAHFSRCPTLMLTS